MAKPRIQFICQSCGSTHQRWGGKCDACGEWNTLVEEGVSGGIGGGPQSLRSPRKGRIVALTTLSGEIEERLVDRRRRTGGAQSQHRAVP